MFSLRSESYHNLEGQPVIPVCRWAALCLAKADDIKVLPPPGRLVPIWLNRRVAEARRTAKHSPGHKAEEAARALLRDVHAWIGVPIRMTATLGTPSGLAGEPLRMTVIMSLEP